MSISIGRIALAGVAAASMLGMTAARADDVADHYRGKTINLLIGFGPGGGYDTYGRILSRHLGKHIPGQPAIVPQNMPGSAGVKVANYVYNAAPKDGTYLHAIASSAALEPLFGNKAAKYETTKFSWIGNMDQDIASCGVWKTSGIKRFAEAMTREVNFGSTGPGSNTGQQALVLKNLLGAKIKVISGYKGTRDINLAMQRGELDATCGMFLSSLKSDFAPDIKSGDLKIVIHFGRGKHAEFGDAVSIYDVVKTDEDRQIADIAFRQSEITRPIGGAPGVPAHIVAALRTAFMATMKDPAFLADAGRTRIEIKPQTGEEVTNAFASYYKTPEAILKRAMAVIGRTS